MFIKINKLVVFVILLTFAVNLIPLDADAAIFDWISGYKNGPQSKFVSFAGIGKDTGVNVEDNSNLNQTPMQLLQKSSIMAVYDPSTTKKTAKSETKTYVVPASAYSSAVDQTDSTPFITAMGTHVRDGVVASNFLPLGTVIKIPEIYGDKSFVVEDRMNARYFYKIDIWFPTREAAREFGLKKVKIEIVS